MSVSVIEKLQARFNRMSPGGRLFAVALVGVSAYAIYVYIQRRRSTQRADKTVDATPTTGMIDSGAIAAEVAGGVSTLIDQLGSDFTSNQAALSNLIAQTSQNTVDALNAQTVAFITGLGDLGTAQQAGLKDTEDRILGAVATGVDKLFGQGGEVLNAINSFAESIVSGVTDVSVKVGTLLTGQEEQTVALGLLQAEIDATKKLGSWALGFASITSCYQDLGGGNYLVNECKFGKGPHELYGSGLDITSSETAIAAFLKSRYSGCFNADENRFDLMCVGAKMAGGE